MSRSYTSSPPKRLHGVYRDCFTFFTYFTARKVNIFANIYIDVREIRVGVHTYLFFYCLFSFIFLEMVQWHLERGFTVSEKLRNTAIWNLDTKLHTLQTSELRLCIEVGCQLRVLAALIPGTDWTKGLTAQYNSERSVEENFPSRNRILSV
jgi:hypothetical protein